MFEGGARGCDVFRIPNSQTERNHRINDAARREAARMGNPEACKSSANHGLLTLCFCQVCHCVPVALDGSIFHYYVCGPPASMLFG